jgi:hypothetical protein
MHLKIGAAAVCRLHCSRKYKTELLNLSETEDDITFALVGNGNLVTNTVGLEEFISEVRIWTTNRVSHSYI